MDVFTRYLLVCGNYKYGASAVSNSSNSFSQHVVPGQKKGLTACEPVSVTWVWTWDEKSEGLVN